MEVRTNDLVLRTVAFRDVREVARLWDYENGRISIKEALKAIRSMAKNHRKNQPGHIHHLCLGVFEKGSRTIIGWCGLDGTAGDDLQIFYFIEKPYRNRGYAGQGAKQLLSYAFEAARVPFVNGGCGKKNHASCPVMMSAGMRQTGTQANGAPLFTMDAKLYEAVKACER